MRRAACLGAVLAVFALDAAAAQERKPPVPPGRDPGGVAVALISAGIDYTESAIAARLARDGEGELIGWDLAGNDRRPFRRDDGTIPVNWGGDGTGLARLLGGTGRRLVAVRLKPPDALALARAAAIIAQTPARIVVLPMWSRSEADWQPFRQAATHFADLLFVAAAADDAVAGQEAPVWPAAFALANVLTVAAPAVAAPSDAIVVAVPGASGPADSRAAAMLAADAIAGCLSSVYAGAKGAALKAAVLTRAARSPAGGRPAIAPCPDGR